MSIETDPVPPLPQHTPPINKRDGALERFENTWMQWFQTVRDKINIINALVVNFSGITGNGFIVIQNSLNWFTRTLQQGSGITITNGDGTAGDPTIAADPEFIRDTIAAALVAGSNITITVSDPGDTITIASTGGSGSVNIFATPTQSWDFVSEGVITSTATGTTFVTNEALPVVYTSGAGSGASRTGESGSPGIISLTTGTTATGRSRIFLCPPVIILGSGEISYKARIRIPTLSDALQRFAVRVTAANAISGAAVQFIAADYDDSVNSGQWVASASDGVSTTTTNTVVAPAANTWTVIDLRVNAAGTEWSLYVGASSDSLVNVGTVSADIPAVPLGLAVFITKSIGTTARTLDVDVASFTQTLTTSR